MSILCWVPFNRKPYFSKRFRRFMNVINKIRYMLFPVCMTMNRNQESWQKLKLTLAKVRTLFLCTSNAWKVMSKSITLCNYVLYKPKVKINWPKSIWPYKKQFFLSTNSKQDIPRMLHFNHSWKYWIWKTLKWMSKWQPKAGKQNLALLKFFEGFGKTLTNFSLGISKYKKHFWINSCLHDISITWKILQIF